jgi:DNA polymerase III alpha subunit
VIGLLRVAVEAAVLLLKPLVERDPEVYESRVVQRWAKRYVALTLLAKNEEDYDKRVRLMSRAMAARTALAHLPVEKKVLDELDLAIHLTVSKGTDVTSN